jgi:hypothetical protein
VTARARTGCDDTVTTDGSLVRLVVDANGAPVGAVVIETPCAWVYRRPWLRLEDVG